MKMAAADGFKAISAPGGVRGRIAEALPENFLSDFLRDPAGFLDAPSARVLKGDAKTKVVQVALSGRDLVIKRFRYTSALRRLGFFLSASPALRSLEGALLLKRRGFDTAAPLAALECRRWNDLGTSYYITEAIAGSCSIRAFWLDAAPALAKKERMRIGRSVIRGLAELFAGLHAAGLYHGDLKGSNILMQDWRSERRRFFLIDLDRVGEHRLSPGRRMKNLLQIKVAWGPRERIYFYLRYAALAAASKPAGKALVRRALYLHRRRTRGPRRGRPGD